MTLGEPPTYLLVLENMIHLTLITPLPPDRLLLDFYIGLSDRIQITLLTTRWDKRNTRGVFVGEPGELDEIDVQVLPMGNEGGFRGRDLSKRVMEADIAQCFGTGPELLEPVLSGRSKAGLPTVCCCLENAVSCRPLGRGYSERRKKALASVDTFLVHSRGSWRMLKDVPGLEEKIRRVPPGVDLESLDLSGPDDRMAQALKITEDHFVVLYWGPLRPERGVYDLIGAAGQIARWGKDTEIRVLLFGNGPEKERLRERIREENLGHFVCLAGEPDSDRIPGILGLADLYIRPSFPTQDWNEPLPLRMLTAMAAGVPVAASAIGEIPDFLGQGGVLLPPRSHHDLADTIVRCAEDRGSLIPYSRAAKARAADRFDRKQTRIQLMSLYEKILEGKSG